jgi:Phage integrase, N-terminal SAM-like domain
MTDKAISPLRQRMIKDMTIRKLAPKTQHDYVQRVKHFAAFLGRSPDTAHRPRPTSSSILYRQVAHAHGT